MKKNVALVFALLGWASVIAQFFLMMENMVAPIPETIIRFFSFFTILTNILVAAYFTAAFFTRDNISKFTDRPGNLTAVTIYITLVGLVYQFALRQVWDPKGLQKVVDEMLHSIIPILVIVFWAIYERTRLVKFIQVLKWAIYPLIYLLIILIRGSYSGFYPYPFVNVTNQGMPQVLINSCLILALFLIISFVFILIGKYVIRRT